MLSKSGALLLKHGVLQMWSVEGVERCLGCCALLSPPNPLCPPPSAPPSHPQVMANNSEMILLPVNEPTFGTKR